MGRIAATKEAAQKAIDYSVNVLQGGEGSDKLGWRYAPKMPGDVSVTGWFVMQIKSGKVAGLQIDHFALEGALKFLATCEADPTKIKKEDDGYDTGRHRYGYTGPGQSVNTTSIGILCQLFTGAKADEVQGAARYLLRASPPVWGANLGTGGAGGAHPMYYTYYTTLVMFQIGGDLWKTWNEGLKKMLLENQRKGGDQDGSWDPMGYDQKVGRAYSTALGALSLEVYYRYVKLDNNR
jgi:hypothetical protein